MKKILTLVIVLSIVVSAAMVFAAAEDVSNNTTLNFHASSNVLVFARASVQSYAAASKHLNGNRTYGASSNETILKFSETIAAGTALTNAVPGDTSTSSAFSGWSSL